MMTLWFSIMMSLDNSLYYKITTWLTIQIVSAFVIINGCYFVYFSYDFVLDIYSMLCKIRFLAPFKIQANICNEYFYEHFFYSNSLFSSNLLFNCFSSTAIQLSSNELIFSYIFNHLLWWQQFILAAKFGSKFVNRKPRN